MHVVLDRSKDQLHADTWHKIHCLKAPHSKEHVSLCAPCHTGACPEDTIMAKTCLYKGELASRSRYTSLFTTLLTHSFSVPLLTCWSANVPTGTFRSTAKTHCCRVGSRYSHIRAFSAVVATQSFSQG
jgi:hypothetical protein